MQSVKDRRIANESVDRGTISSPIKFDNTPTLIEGAVSNLADGNSARIHYLDNLRAWAMLLGVYLHGALAYADPAQSIWLATDSHGSRLIDASVWFIHLFRMSLFFVLSGYFAKMLIERRGCRAFLWNRGIRILLPLAFFYPLLLVAMTIVVAFAISYLDRPQGLMQLIVAASEQPGDKAQRAPLNTMHLWFLHYLAMFSLIAVGASHVAQRWTWLSFVSFERLSKSRWSWRLALLAPLLLVPSVLAAGVPLPAPEAWVPVWWPFLFYGLFYWAGWQWFGREGTLESWQPSCWRLVLLSCILFIPYYCLLPSLDLKLILESELESITFTHLVVSFLTAYLSVILTITALLLGQRYLSQASGRTKFIADSSYWMYLLHLPLVIFLQTLLIPLALPVWIKLPIVILSAMLFCLASYVVFVRYTPLGWMLHGKRAFP